MMGQEEQECDRRRGEDTMKGTGRDIAREWDTMTGNWMGRKGKDSGTGRDRKKGMRSEL